jgi:hypothetical protein
MKKIATPLVTALFALTSFSILAQQQRPTSPPDDPATQQNSPGMEQAPPDSPTSPARRPAASTPQEAPAAQLSPVNGELVSKLDSKTAKAGDSVVVQTKASVKTADGTDIPKGSKLVGHVIAVQPSTAGENSQMALQFDHFELKGGQNLPVQSQIQSIAPPESAASAGGFGSSPKSMGAPPAGSSDPGMNGANGSRASSAPQSAAGYPDATPGPISGSASGPASPAAGTIVAKTGNIAIRTTSVPGVLLANNAPGQQDPRMAQASSILLGAKQDIQLSGGTQMVLGVAAAGGGAH